MNRVLSWPHTPMVPGLLDALKASRHTTVVTDRGTVRFTLPLGPVEMRFSEPRHQLAPGTEVFVWWKLGGFICAPSLEVKREERASRRMAERVRQARLRLAAARRERQAERAAHVDIVLPMDEPAAPARA
jgi:hypothetical protein